MTHMWEKHIGEVNQDIAFTTNQYKENPAGTPIP